MSHCSHADFPITSNAAGLAAALIAEREKRSQAHSLLVNPKD